MRVVSLNLHPVKSTAIRPVAHAEVGPAGLVGDREWMVVDATGELVSARELPQLFAITADCRATGADTDLTLTAPGVPPLVLERPTDGDRVSVSMFGKAPLPARAAPIEATHWLSRVLGRTDLRLVWCSDPAARALNSTRFRDGDHAAFQDGSPVSLVSTGSVQAVAEWAAAGRADSSDGTTQAPSLDERRFRQNIVVDGCEPFAEDSWGRVRIGEVTFRAAGRIARCVMTTIDPDTLAKGKEPIASLARHRREDGKTWLGLELVAEATGMLRLGDEVTLL